MKFFLSRNETKNREFSLKIISTRCSGSSIRVIDVRMIVGSVSVSLSFSFQLSMEKQLNDHFKWNFAFRMAKV